MTKEDRVEEDIRTLTERVTALGTSPIPAWVFSLALLMNELHKTRNKVDFQGTSGGSYKFRQQLLSAKPTRASALTFGITNLLGGYMIYDGDVSNGAGFGFAWSTLYLIVNGTSGLKSLVRGSVAPLGLSVLALANVGLYGKQFFWS